MKINFLSFNPIKITTRKPQNTTTLQNIAMQNDVFVKSATVFKGNNCSTSNFKVKNLENLHCPVCGYIMLDDEQQMAFAEDVYNKRGAALIQTLEKYEDESIFTHKQTPDKKSAFNPQRQQIIDIIKNLALKHPSFELSQLVQLQADKCIASLISKQIEIVDELTKFIEENTIDESELQALKAVIEEHKKRIYGKSETHFSRKVFIYELLKEVKNHKNKEKISQIASQLPTSTDDTDAFFVKYARSKKTSKQIAQKIVEQSSPTAEHLLPASKGGASNLSNYICDCASCNNQRSDKDFIEWQEEIPDFQKNLQEYLQAVQRALDEGKLPDNYDSYIVNVIETINRLSKGRISLYRPDSTLDDTTAKTISKRRSIIAKHKEDMNEVFQEKSTLERTISNAERSPYYEKITSGEQTIEEIQASLEMQAGQLKSLLDQHQTILDEQKITCIIPQLRANLNSLKQETQELIDRNKRLVRLNLANPSDTKKYEEYLHKKELYDEALKQRDNYSSRKNSKEFKTIIEILNYAIKALQDKITEDEASEMVEYFRNIETIAINEERMKPLRQEIHKLTQQKQKTNARAKSLEAQLGKKTIKDIKEEYSQILQAQKTLENIQKLPQLKSRLSELTDIAQYNGRILKRAENTYKTISNREFDDLIQRLYL